MVLKICARNCPEAGLMIRSVSFRRACSRRCAGLFGSAVRLPALGVLTPSASSITSSNFGVNSLRSLLACQLLHFKAGGVTSAHGKGRREV